MVKSRNGKQACLPCWNTAEKNFEAPFQTSGKQCHEINGVGRDGRAAKCAVTCLPIPGNVEEKQAPELHRSGF